MGLKRIILIVGAGAAMLSTSCVKHDELAGDDGRLTLASRMMDTPTRATLDNTWEGGEQVQVSIDDGSAATFAAATDGTLTPVSTLYWPAGSQTLSARAWYPSSWAMLQDQSTAAKIQSADFIFAPTVSGLNASTAASNPLVFYHRMSKVTVNLVAGTDIADVSGATVAFYGYTSGAPDTSDAGDGVIAGSGGDWIVPFAQSNTYTALLIPRAMAGVEFVKVTLGGIDYFYTPATGEANLEQGKAYVYDITVNKTRLDVKVVDNGATWSAGGNYSTTASAPLFMLDGVAAGTPVTVNFTNGTSRTDAAGMSGSIASLSSESGLTVKSLQIDGGAEILIGRKVDGSAIKLKFDSDGSLVFRSPTTASDPTPIDAYAEFQLIDTAPSGNYIQEADLDLMGTGVSGVPPWAPVGTSASPFGGTFDGANHKIIGMYVNNNSSDYFSGLFGNVVNGTVKNLGVEGSINSTTSCVGGIVGWITTGSLEDCYFTGTISNTTYDMMYNRVGGVAGYVAGSNVVNCYSTATISSTSNGMTAKNYVGGVAGSVESFGGGSALSNCYSTSAVGITTTGMLSINYIGGVAGNVAVDGGGSSTLSNCAALNPSITYSGGVSYAGRVAGANTGGTLSGNVAFSGMTGGGAANTHDGMDGQDISGGDVVAATFWKTTAGNWTAWGTAWTTAANRLPGLFGQTVDMPDYMFAVSFSSGTGTATNPYIITTPEQLKWLSVAVNTNKDDPNGGKFATKYYELGNDIPLTNYGAGFDGGKGWTPIGNSASHFSGTFTGAGYKITGLTINSSDYCIGLFGYIDSGAKIDNLSIENATITAGNDGLVGGVVGNNRGTVSNCSFTGSVNGPTLGVSSVATAIGGVVGLNNGGAVTNCGNAGTEKSANTIGGVVGSNTYGTVTNCSNTGTVGNVTSYIGGVVGRSDGGTITDCHNSGAVTDAEYAVGGVVGYSTAGSTVKNCYNTVAITGGVNTYAVGGVVGINYNGGAISECYNTGEVSSAGDGHTYIGGVVGYAYCGPGNSNSVSNCYSTGTISASGSGDGCAGGLVGTAVVDGDYSISNCYSTSAVSSSTSGLNDAGGVVGIISILGGNGSVSNCAALNPSVTVPSGIGNSAGRVTGVDIGGMLYGNVAFSGMSGGGAAKTHNGEDGQDIAAADIVAATFWKTSAGTWTTWDATWTTAANALPGLFGNTVPMPAYIH